MKLKIEYLSKEDLKPYANNAKIHTGEQIEQIKKSIKEFGFNDPIAVWHDNEIVEGHGRLLAAMEMDINEVPIIRLDDLTDEQRRAYMLIHNKLNMNTGFDLDILDGELDLLTVELPDLDMADFGFEFNDFDEHEEDEEDIQFSLSPQYEPTGAEVEIADLFDDKKTKDLIAEIEKANIDDLDKEFLKKAAYRHTVFNYKNIAEYYANADENVQNLMEKSALVIIDTKDAIANGYVQLTKKIKDMVGDYND